MWKPDVCLYHSPCDDGFACAWIVRGKWPDCVLAPTNYGLAFPDIDIVGKNLLIADFSYKPEVLADLLKRGAASIVILDHHKTAEADLAAFKVGAAGLVLENVDLMLRAGADVLRPPILARFAMEHSGAALTWEFCYPDRPLPIMLQFIEDRDLWRFNLKETRAFTLYLRSFSYDFPTWDAISQAVETDPNMVMGSAFSIERFYDQKLAEMLPTAVWKNIGKWNVPVAHAPYAFASDLAHELLKAHPDAAFAAVVVDAYGGRTYSLRSEDSRQDVSEVAKSFGGGGHRNASGFRVPA
jgi:uncharacterized protein